MNATIDNLASAAATILYVDDEAMARKYFVHSVDADYEVITAPDADSAIQILQDNDVRIDILVTDYRMPGRDGGDLLRYAAREFPYVVRILVTAYADREVLLDTVNSGEVFRILEKPLNLSELKSTLHLAYELSRERSARQQRLKAIDEALAFLVHELNTPLAAIINFARGVQRRFADDNVSPQQQADIGKAMLAVDGNARYCLLLLSTFVESIQENAALSARHIGHTAQQMILSLLDGYPLTPIQRAAIQVEIQEDFRITALPNCVALVLSSLLSNALRAIRDRESPVIRITALMQNNPQIRIVDNGSGIPPEILDRLMTDPVTSHAEAGAKGWGMVFCKRIMQSIGGDILVHSTPDAFTSVTLNFPAAKNQVKRSE